MSVKVPKKRGRKPKGGKIVSKNINLNEDVNLFTNVIVHLKCTKSSVTNEGDFLSDMQYNPSLEVVESFSMMPTKELSYELLENEEDQGNAQGERNIVSEGAAELRRPKAGRNPSAAAI